MSTTAEQLQLKTQRRLKFRFTDAEKSVLGMVVAGDPNKVIAHSLGVSLKEVDSILYSLYQRTDTDGNRVKLAVWAVRNMPEINA